MARHRKADKRQNRSRSRKGKRSVGYGVDKNSCIINIYWTVMVVVHCNMSSCDNSDFTGITLTRQLQMLRKRASQKSVFGWRRYKLKEEKVSGVCDGINYPENYSIWFYPHLCKAHRCYFFFFFFRISFWRLYAEYLRRYRPCVHTLDKILLILSCHQRDRHSVVNFLRVEY